jgi:hypothetical protein
MIQDLAWHFGSFGNQLQNNLFKVADSTLPQQAVDLFATNINRGRDHGLQPYVYYVKQCLGINIYNFSDLTILMNTPNINTLMSLYE